MSRSRMQDRVFDVTLLHKLFDLDDSDAPVVPFQSLNELKRSVSRDLEALLNSRRGMQHSFASYPEVQQSVLNFGILDFVGLSTANPADCERICMEIARTIEQQDSRLRQVRVELDPVTRRVNCIGFNIRAVLVVNALQEQVTFDALLQPSTQQYQILVG